MQFTIRQLRRAGFKVRVIHTRNHKKVRKLNGYYYELLAKGGTTTIQITSSDKHSDVEGIAVCSNEDNFNRKLGNSIALGRALIKFDQDTLELLANKIKLDVVGNSQ
jgi:hypothetical protein